MKTEGKSMEEKFSDAPDILKRIREKRIGGQVAPDAPKISVVIPAYNAAAFIVETLDSVFRQTFENYEVILVNDGSTDTADLKAALIPYFDKIIYAEQSNSGAAKARNTAICLARGDFLAFLDGDDIWSPEFLASQVNFLEQKNLEMVYCDALLFGEPLFEGRNYMQDAPSDGEVSAAALIGGQCNVITSGTILKKDLLVKNGMFDAEVSSMGMEDFDLWFRLAQNGAKIGYQRKVLLKYRVRPNSLSGSNVRRTERTLFAYQTIERKYNLTDAETAILNERRQTATAEYHLETGKFHLTEGNYVEAQTHFAEANKYYRKPKLALVNFLMRFSPRLTVLLFKKMRPSEFSFILPKNVE